MKEKFKALRGEAQALRDGVSAFTIPVARTQAHRKTSEIL
jgi:hypothetical protein